MQNIFQPGPNRSSLLNFAQPSRIPNAIPVAGKMKNAQDPRTLVARVKPRESLPRQDAPAPLSRRHVPANVAVAEFPLQNDAEPVAEKVEVGRVAWKSRVDDVDGIGGDIVLQTRPRFLASAAAQYQKCHKDCCCAAHRSAPPRGRGSMGV